MFTVRVNDSKNSDSRYVIAQQDIIMKRGNVLYIAPDIDLHNHWQHFLSTTVLSVRHS